MKWDKIFSYTAAFLGGALSYVFGTPDMLFYALLALVCIDYISGVIVAVIKKELSSRIGFRGICKKALIFLVVAVGNVADTAIFGTGSGLRGAVIIFFIANEAVSILENATEAGLPVPARLSKVLRQVKDSAEAGGDEKEED